MKTKLKIVALLGLGLIIVNNRSLYMYGLLSKNHLYEMIDDVVDVFGGGENAKNLLKETAEIESKSGTYPYNPFREYGLGVMQFDKIGFTDTIARTPKHIKQKVWDRYQIDIDKISYHDLRFSPLYSVILARLKYLLVPYSIPSTKEERAKYWYKWYNGGGAGSLQVGINKYLKATQRVSYA